MPARPIDLPRLDRQAVIDAAAALVDRQGIDALTTSTLAVEVRARPSALYRYVAGLDDVLSALALHAREILVRRLEGAIAGVAGDDAVRAVANAWRAFVHEHPGLYTATSRVPVSGDAEQEAAVQAVVGVLAAAVSGYRLGPTGTMHAARSLRSALHGFTDIEKDAGHPSAASVDESFRQLVELLCAGFAASSVRRGESSRHARAATPAARARAAKSRTRAAARKERTR